MAQQKVTFKIAETKALKVSKLHLFLAGNFNGWNPADTAWEMRADSPGHYHLSKAMPRGIYNFKITRGSWQTVECAADGKPIENRNFVVSKDTVITLSVSGWQDDFAVAEKVHTASARVHIVDEKFNIPQLGRQRRIWIYLPSGYLTSNKKYPVIYMHDGQNLFDAYTSGYGEWGIDEIMDKLPDAKQCIIVGIDHGGDNRITEYDPYGSKYGKGRGDDYVEFLVKTLKPYIDAHYHTIADARHTSISGSSMGGLISMYAILKYPNVFGKAGIFSPAFWIAPDIFLFAQQQHLSTKSGFYFVCGDAESATMVSDMKKMADIIHSKSISEENAPVVIVKGASHNEKQWNGDFPAFYVWLLKEW
ncbi:alpha/beta hydrolase [Mucilaginibacter sp. X4EP1]|uniref:alpha/beta hydrolase n=1 Tax=Mucilaginibacter sp. X4EP1 TaxID=2723092 RepID=UPI002168B9D7|nr:alpha/beta hydrolase-fold protein [Mucilaginibacter sp. X4EP1]